MATSKTCLTNIIDGKLEPPGVLAGGAFLKDVNTGEVLQQLADTASEAVERAIAAADRAHRSGLWSGLSLQERANALARVATELKARCDDIAVLDAVNTGVALAQCKGFIAYAASTFEISVPELNSMFEDQFEGAFGKCQGVRAPWGPAVIIGPWNAPVSTVASKVAIALVVGCPVILKPSEWAPRGSDVFARAIHAANLPPGVFQLLHGAQSVGQQLVADPRVRCVNFTGSEAIGHQVASKCAEGLKPVLLELGGCAPMLVLQDADVDFAAQGVLRGMTLLNGQWCCGLTRLLVHSSLKESLLQAVLTKLRALTLSSSLTEVGGETMGPLCHEAHAQMLRERVAELISRGGVAYAPSQLPMDAPATFFAPTLVDGLKHEDCLTEIFGPVATLHTFESDDEAVAMANAAPAFLLGAVYTKDLERGFQLASKLRASICMVNGQEFGINTTPRPHPAVSFWGGAGYGRDCSTEALVSFFTGARAVGINGVMPGARPGIPQVTTTPAPQAHAVWSPVACFAALAAGVLIGAFLTRRSS